MSDTPEGRRQIHTQEEFDQMVKLRNGYCAEFDCHIPIEITESNCPRPTHFRDANFFKEVKILNINIQEWDLWFDKVNFHADVLLDKLENPGRLDFSFSAFKKHFSIYRSTLGTLAFNEIEGQEEWFFKSVLFINSFSIYKSNLERVRLENIESQGKLKFDSVSFGRELAIYRSILEKTEILNSRCKRLTVINNQLSEKFKISQSDRKQYANNVGHDEFVLKVKIEKLYFINNTIREGMLVRFGYLDVTHFYFWNMRNPINSELNIGECNFKKWTFHGLRNSGKFRIYKINIGIGENKSEDCTFEESSFGDSEFHNVNLRCYKTVSMKDNLFSNLHYTGMQWPDELKSGDMSDQQKRDTYRTLKKVTQENNDAPQAMKFYAKEMQTHKNITFSKIGNKIDKIVLCFNHWTNNFGLNWFLPIGWILGLGGLFYWLLLLSSNYEIFSWDNWSKFWVFLNPTHKTEFIAKDNWSGLTYFIDFLFRIIEALLIYQTVIAFRKFTRKL